VHVMTYRSRCSIVIVLSVVIVVVFVTSVAAGPGQLYTVTLPDGEKVSVEAVRRGEVRITLANGHRVTRHETEGMTSWSAGHDVTNDEIDRAEEAYQLWVLEHGSDLYDKRERNPSTVLGGLLIIVAGLVSLISPYTSWYLSIGWRIKDAEPTDLALGINRLTGVVLLVVGFLFLF